MVVSVLGLCREQPVVAIISVATVADRVRLIVGVFKVFVFVSFVFLISCLLPSYYPKPCVEVTGLAQ